MHLVGKPHFIVNYIEQQLVRQTSSFLVFGAAVYDFLKDYVTVGVVCEVREGDNPLEIEAVPVDVACYYHRPARGQTNQIAPSESVRLVGFHAFLKQLDYFVGHFSRPDD
jgi:hypothetical protein